MISSHCCYTMKKGPMRLYKAKNNKCKFILGTMTEESRMRRQAWIRTGCNAYTSDPVHQISTPMSFWTEQDVLAYLVREGLEIAEPYGEIRCEGGKYCTTGCARTG